MQMTARELSLYASGVNERHAVEWKEQLTLTHLQASLVRCKKSDFPTLKKLLGMYAPPTRASVAAKMKAQRIAATLMSFAGTPKPKTKKAKRNG